MWQTWDAFPPNWVYISQLQLFKIVQYKILNIWKKCIQIAQGESQSTKIWKKFDEN